MLTRPHFHEWLRERQNVPYRANFPSPLARVVGPGIIRPETNAPHWVQRAGFSQTFVAQKAIFHGGLLREFGIGAS